MRIVITDSSFLWKNQEPILEQIKDELLIVCFDGKAVTDKYECFVCPVQESQQEVTKDILLRDPRFDAFESVSDEFYKLVVDCNDILFLADDDSSTLYPFYSYRSYSYDSQKIHLCVISPFWFDWTRNLHRHRQIISDLNHITSVLYIDSNNYIKDFPKTTAVNVVMQSTLPKMRADYLAALPVVVDSIEGLDGKYYFDLSTNSYVDVSNGLDGIEQDRRHLFNSKIIEKMQDRLTLTGMVLPNFYPDSSEDTKAKVEKLSIRKDGKKICEYLRNLRAELAKTNGIEFTTAECTYLGSCAGTCPVCDKEAAYLREKLNEIAPENRVIPNLSLTKWEVKK